MKVRDEVEFELYKLVAQMVIMRGGDVERIPLNYQKIRDEAIKMGLIYEDSEKSVANPVKKVLTVDRG